MRQIQSRNPYTGILKQACQFISDQELKGKIELAAKAFQGHKARSYEERAAMLVKLADVIEKRSQEISLAITEEMGKPIVQSEAEVKKSVAFCRYYGSEFIPPQPKVFKSAAKKHCIQKYLPIGVLYFLIPFNFPFFLHFKGILPNLLLGNVVLTRSADSCPRVGKLTEECMFEAGLSNGEYNDVFTKHEQLDMILEHPAVGGISFTGSSKAGSIIASKAGTHLKRSVMELGGNDPLVVLEDGDVQMAITEAVKWRIINAGQVCTAPKRFIIDKKHYERFKAGIIEGVKKIKFGDPMDRQTQIGPLAREDLYQNLELQLKNMPKSYKIIYQREDMKKPFFPITVIEAANQEWDQELFGPCFQLFKAQSEAQALQIANFGYYGLGSSVFSASRGQEFADNIRSGITFVNAVPVSDHKYPIGGVCKSGFGRQCQAEGYLQFANHKTHFAN